MLGVFARQWLEPMAHVLKALGSKKVWLVHGSDGLDELTTTGPTFVTALDHGTISSFEITPEQAGLPLASAEELRGGDPDYNAKALIAVLQGEKNAYRNIALLNAAAALVVADRCTTLKQGVEIASKALDSGAAHATLTKLINASQQG